MERIYYTDGGCRGNGTTNSTGGWAWIEVGEDGSISAHQFDYCEDTTNNQMELKAMISVLKEIDGTEDNVTIYCDSMYVANILNSWARTWESNGWTRAGGKKIENLSLVKEVYNYYNKNIWNCQIRWTKGHCGNDYNDLVDALTWNEEKFFELARKKGIEVDESN